MVINPIVGVYIPIIRFIRIPIKGGMTIPNIASFDPKSDVVVTGKVDTNPKIDEMGPGLAYTAGVAWFSEGWHVGVA